MKTRFTQVLFLVVLLSINLIIGFAVSRAADMKKVDICDQSLTDTSMAGLRRLVKVVFCSGFIYEICFVKGSDKSDRYNIGVFHQN